MKRYHAGWLLFVAILGAAGLLLPFRGNQRQFAPAPGAESSPAMADAGSIPDEMFTSGDGGPRTEEQPLPAPEKPTHTWWFGSGPEITLTTADWGPDEQQLRQFSVAEQDRRLREKQSRHFRVKVLLRLSEDRSVVEEAIVGSYPPLEIQSMPPDWQQMARELRSADALLAPRYYRSTTQATIADDGSFKITGFAGSGPQVRELQSARARLRGAGFDPLPIDIPLPGLADSDVLPRQDVSSEVLLTGRFAGDTVHGKWRDGSIAWSGAYWNQPDERVAELVAAIVGKFSRPADPWAQAQGEREAEESARLIKAWFPDVDAERRSTLIAELSRLQRDHLRDLRDAERSRMLATEGPMRRLLTQVQFRELGMSGAYERCLHDTKEFVRVASSLAERSGSRPEQARASDDLYELASHFCDLPSTISTLALDLPEWERSASAPIERWNAEAFAALHGLALVSAAGGYSRDPSSATQELTALVRRLLPAADDQAVEQLTNRLISEETRWADSFTGGLKRGSRWSQLGFQAGQTSTAILERIQSLLERTDPTNNDYQSLRELQSIATAQRLTAVLAEVAIDRHFTPRETVELVAHGLVRNGVHAAAGQQRACMVLAERFRNLDPPQTELADQLAFTEGTRATREKINERLPLPAADQKLSSSPAELRLYGKLAAAR